MISHGNLIYAMGQALALFEATIEVYTVGLQVLCHKMA